LRDLSCYLCITVLVLQSYPQKLLISKELGGSPSACRARYDLLLHFADAGTNRFSALQAGGFLNSHPDFHSTFGFNQRQSIKMKFSKAVTLFYLVSFKNCMDHEACGLSGTCLSEENKL